MRTKEPVSRPRPNRVAQVWTVLLAGMAGVIGMLFVYSAVVAALFGGVLPLVLTTVVWLVLFGTPAVLRKRARTRDKGAL